MLGYNRKFLFVYTPDIFSFAITEECCSFALPANFHLEMRHARKRVMRAFSGKREYLGIFSGSAGEFKRGLNRRRRMTFNFIIVIQSREIRNAPPLANSASNASASLAASEF